MAVYSGPSNQWILNNPDGIEHIKSKTGVVQTDLLVQLDASIYQSYPGSGTIWYDLKGNYNATLVNGPTFNNNYRGNFSLDGSNDHFTLPSGFQEFTNGLTVFAFVNFGSASTWERIVDFGNGSASSNILFARSSTTNTLVFELYDGSTSRGKCNVSNGVLNNTIAQYAVTLNGTNCIMYRNGTQLQSFNYAFLPTNVVRTINYIGRSNWADAYFQTEISSLYIYSRALSAAEIQQNFNALRKRFNI